MVWWKGIFDLELWKNNFTFIFLFFFGKRKFVLYLLLLLFLSKIHFRKFLLLWFSMEEEIFKNLNILCRYCNEITILMDFYFFFACFVVIGWEIMVIWNSILNYKFFCVFEFSNGDFWGFFESAQENFFDEVYISHLWISTF